MKIIPILLIRFYQYFISPLLGPNCRFYPTCSEYSKECFHRFPIHRALWYSSRRIIRCNPYCEGGHDPVPKQ
ncbi:MAG: membrane protein insertion efficiency factor YidD [Alphaproteobacteria bacterium]|nr:MAG: membrane protein insertion efficiency factor YidD [Alphaproteobacteria bacterium]